MQRIFAGTALFLADGLLLLGSLAEAQNFIFPLVAFAGFNCWLLMELNVQLPLPNRVLHLAPATVGWFAAAGAFVGFFFLGYTPKFANMLCGASVVVVAVSMLSFWFGELPSRTMLGYMSAGVAMQALAFVVLHKAGVGVCLGLWALAGFLKRASLPTTEYWFGNES